MKSERIWHDIVWMLSVNVYSWLNLNLNFCMNCFLYLLWDCFTEMDDGAVPLVLCHMLQKDFNHPPFIALSPAFKSANQYPSGWVKDNNKKRTIVYHLSSIKLCIFMCEHSWNGFIPKPKFPKMIHTFNSPCQSFLTICIDICLL